MRPIKFRQPVFDLITRNRFLYWHYWGFINGGFISPNMVVNEDLENSQQYIGLPDKDGKEIYEGDLFHCIYYPEGHEDHIYQVCYSEEVARFFLKRIGVACVQVAVIQTVADVSRYEIIGNIYENGDLLNAKRD